MTTMEFYSGFMLTAVKQSNGDWMVEIVRFGGSGKPFLTQAFREMKAAMAAARLIVDRGITR
jgi:hypothetical protein